MASVPSSVDSQHEPYEAMDRRALSKRRARRPGLRGWLFVMPALTAYAAFVLWPIVQAFRYSFYNWDGVVPAQWAGFANFKTVFSNEQLLGVIGHAFELIVFFSGVPVLLGLAAATALRRFITGRIGPGQGRSSSCPKSCPSSPPGSHGAGCCLPRAQSTRSLAGSG